MAKRWLIGGLAVGVGALVVTPETRTWLRRRLGLEAEDRRWFEEESADSAEHEGDEPLDTREARFSLRARLSEDAPAEHAAAEQEVPPSPDPFAAAEPEADPHAAEAPPESTPEPAPFAVEAEPESTPEPAPAPFAAEPAPEAEAEPEPFAGEPALEFRPFPPEPDPEPEPSAAETASESWAFAAAPEPEPFTAAPAPEAEPEPFTAEAEPEAFTAEAEPEPFTAEAAPEPEPFAAEPGEPAEAEPVARPWADAEPARSFEPESTPFTPPERETAFSAYESLPAIVPEADAPKTPGEDTDEVGPLPPLSAWEPTDAPPPPPSELRPPAPPPSRPFPSRPFSDGPSFRSAIDAARERVHEAAREATPDEDEGTEQGDEHS
jgi:hypothetical protein